MAKKNESEDCCADPSAANGFKIESILSIDDRGQMVLPKEVRERAGISPGDKLALISFEKDGAICCMSLIKSEELQGMVSNLLGPMMQEVIAR